MTGKHTRRAGAALRTLQMAGFPCPAMPSGRAATKRARSLNDQFQARSQETSMMTTIGTRPYPDDGAAVTGRTATMPPVTGPGRPGRTSRTRLHLAVAAAGGPAGRRHDRGRGRGRRGRPRPARRAGIRRRPAGHGTASQPSPAAGTGR